MLSKPTIICLTPIRNEAWILEKFLACASLWADHIIVADQNSSDESREIVGKFNKCILIDNKLNDYNEVDRQRLLINEARKIPGKKLLVALDADEIFTADFQKTDEWKMILNSKEGSIFGFNWINLLPGLENYWMSEGYFPWAFMDDGSAHNGEEIHSPRVPVSDWDKIIKINEFKVLHFQYVNWNRMLSKHAYYQCLEKIKYPSKSAVAIYRMYHHMFAINKSKIKKVKDEWFLAYENIGIGIRDIATEQTNWFDQEVETLVNEHGPAKFVRLNIWERHLKKKDPRGILDIIIQNWLKRTNNMQSSKVIIKIDSILKRIY